MVAKALSPEVRAEAEHAMSTALTGQPDQPSGLRGAGAIAFDAMTGTDHRQIGRIVWRPDRCRPCGTGLGTRAWCAHSGWCPKGRLASDGSLPA